MNTQDESVKMDRGVNALTSSEMEQVAARQGSAGHAERAREIEGAMQATPLPASDHKAQLRGRVEARLNEMAAAIAQLGADPANKSRVRDLEAAMQAAQGVMSGGWDRVGEMEAGQLALWLESNQNTGLTPPLPTQ